MTLSTKHRSALFDAFAPLAGEEATEAMLAELPASENDELVTKQFLRAELADLRTELKGDIAVLRNELKDSLRSQTHWILGAMLGLFGAVTTIGGMVLAFGR